MHEFDEVVDVRRDENSIFIERAIQNLAVCRAEQVSISDVADVDSFAEERDRYGR